MNELMKLRRETGSLEPRRQGHAPCWGQLASHAASCAGGWRRPGELTLDELRLELAARGVSVHRSNVGRLLHRLGLSHKKTLQASEQQRTDIREACQLWITRRRRFFADTLPRLVFRRLRSIRGREKFQKRAAQTDASSEAPTAGPPLKRSPVLRRQTSALGRYPYVRPSA